MVAREGRTRLEIVNLVDRQWIDRPSTGTTQMSASPRRTITDDLLEVAVRIKREAGVTHSQIQEAIDKYACQEQWQERTGGIGFPLVEDIPQTGRAPFLAMLSDLLPDADRRAALVATGRNVSANEIWPSRVS
jgi:hypothetical protein